ncbi:hypothetical protein PHYSODRAFT_330604 [Phytophthora sojae]|uniref:HAT C-terminal dimerisation domain-containing protein n=1 Tax=Phytophthora sojae (strain P6497) TaxID=1094619 RepID=G4ZEL8_PHYSP|nr:hypothetical protein PHYSODRAFT_330604 [Phytophthora sojae]EGZ16541.1 hypothetical protein PHYSODRAFT_330604 [Phytophthora sojae]|eukprot:XP_009525599.1 hypothetical protein PHYSODRAFT_330604 [Phytophthora sojae]
MLTLPKSLSHRSLTLLWSNRTLAGSLGLCGGATDSLLDVDIIFDGVTLLERYPKLKPRLSADAPSINNVALESGIVKLQRTEALTPAERAACTDFRLSKTAAPQPTPPSDLSIVQQAFKRCKVAKHPRYTGVVFAPYTSNECERFFSATKLVYSDLRKRMDASTLETLMFLMYNKDMWDVYTVEAVSS